jgi:hypothetical protein
VQVLPALRGPDDRRAVLDGDALGRLLAGALFHVALGLLRLARVVLSVRVAFHFAVLVDVVAPVRFPLPALPFLDARDGPVRGLDVEAAIRLDHFQRHGVDAVHGDMQVRVVGVGVQAVHRLVADQAQFLHEDVDRFLDLSRGRSLALLPAQDIVVDGVGAAHRFLRQRQHLGLLRGVLAR